jgi:hypothetical protein
MTGFGAPRRSRRIRCSIVDISVDTGLRKRRRLLCGLI